ncbi:MAG: 3-hydroxyacyl-CoA dehydrogenase family protein [Candidatus Hydrogenedentota bacterium]|nr:MAG: 3-hydroxyacyl-CoA dehydrogenase family protein [Candidatus Hydrogenedentota bacterium]
MREIKKVAVLGASGNMGSLSGGIFAQAGIEVIFFARTKEKAEKGMQKAIGQARSDVLRNYIIPETYEALEKYLPEVDWIFEGLAEDMSIKNQYFDIVDKYRKKGSIVSTVSSGLSIEAMAEGRSEDFQAHFMGTHFYNPPAKLPANELIFHPKNSDELKKFVYDFCEKKLRRVNIITNNTPAFAGNRVGFQFLNEAAIYAIEHGPELVDYLLGPYTGRAMAPLSTIDLVGLDVHKAIVDNVYEKTNDERHDTWKMPDYMHKMMERGQLGWKAGAKGGFFKRDENKQKLVLNIETGQHEPAKKVKVDWVEQAKAYIHDGSYQQAIDLIKTAEGKEADIVRHFILGYISYSFHRIGEVTPEEDSIHGIDRVMSFGFSWLPPSGWVDLLGGPKETIALIEKANLPVPESLKKMPEEKICRIPEITRFLNGR